MASELVYRGTGSRPSGPPRPWDDDNPNDPDSPTGYVADGGLADAVNAAILLNQPLLIMGEPGTGKTQLARSVAWELHLPRHTFNTKMNSAGYNLFYHYDSLLHFHDTQILKTQHSPSKYIRYAALGKAILFSNPPSAVARYLPPDLAASHKAATRSVVLIDEIDKAPRDFPNDILAETERLEFLVRETDWTISANRELFPILIFTSNQERNLPDAFLRRCIFYFIPFPDEPQLRDIVRRRLTGDHDAAIGKFWRSAPTTSWSRNRRPLN